MRHGRTTTCVVVVALAWVAPLMAATTAADGLVKRGNGRDVPACQTCHGADGGGQAAAGFPRLAGLDAAYLARQLDDYAAGTRTDAVMRPIAQALSTAERTALAAYYGRLPTPPRPAADTPPANTRGAELATRGRWAQRVPSCEQCHGPGGIGVGAHFPPLAGQPATYIAAQLRAWQQGRRRNDPLQLMAHVSRALSAQDILAVAHWFAAQPATIAPERP